MIEQVTEWMNLQVLPTIDFKKHNKKGYRRCINAKKDMFRLAYAMHSKLGLKMSNCSLFFRGCNFEVKYINVFNLSDEDMADYARILAEDTHEAETSKLQAKKKNEEPEAEAEAESVEKEEAEDDLNKTRVEKMVDDSVVHELKNKG